MQSFFVDSFYYTVGILLYFFSVNIFVIFLVIGHIFWFIVVLWWRFTNTIVDSTNLAMSRHSTNKCNSVSIRNQHALPHSCTYMYWCFSNHRIAHRPFDGQIFTSHYPLVFQSTRNTHSSPFNLATHIFLLLMLMLLLL